MSEIFGKAAATRRTRRCRRARQAVVAFAAIVILAGCTPLPRVAAQGEPSDPGAPAKPVAYRSTLGPYQSGRPVDPAPWGAQNQRVTPQPKSE
jgi:hypothetical protein